MKQNQLELDREVLESIATLLRAFGDSTRLALLQELRSGEKSVMELVELIGGSQSNISKQLRLLFEAGLTKREKRANQVFYNIGESELVETICQGVCDKLNRDATSRRKQSFAI